ncbi:MAG: ribbon-helix-helix domain-containing protein [Dolichospermum sp.]
MKNDLQQWADSENRTLSNLVETLSETSVTERKQNTKAS